MSAIKKETYTCFLKEIQPTAFTDAAYSSPSTWPTAIYTTITEQAKLFAAKKCTLSNLTTKKTTLETSIMSGEIPSHLEYKFKRLYNEPHEMPFKTAMLKHAMESEVEATRLKILSITNDINNCHTILSSALTPIMGTMLDKPINSSSLKLLFNFAINEFHAQFNKKHLHDQKDKEAKKIKAQEAKEKASAPAVITSRDHAKLQNQIKSLTLKLKKATIHQKEKKDFKKGALPTGQSKSPQKRKESNKKRENGSKQDSSKNKKYRGKNGD